MKLALVLSALLFTGSAFAAKTAKVETKVPAAGVKPGKITCEEFTVLDETVKPQVVGFIEGITKSGKVEEAVIVIDKVSNPVVWVIDECKKTPKETVLSKVETWVKTKAKKI